MSKLNRRQARCMNAIGNALKHLRKKESPDELLAVLEDRFLSAGGILESSTPLLVSAGLVEAEAQLFDLIPDLTRHVTRMKFGDRPVISHLGVAGEYLKTLYIGVPIEQFYALYLNASGRLIQCKLLQKGSVDEAPFYLDQVLQDVILTGADALVLSHNHPGGTARPSKADIRCTLNAISALYSLGVPLLDHIIIADGQAVSLRENAFVPVALWINQDPSSALLRNWLQHP